MSLIRLICTLIAALSFGVVDALAGRYATCPYVISADLVCLWSGDHEGRPYIEGEGEQTKLFPNCNYFFLTEDQGLPNGFVSDIIMDSRGYVWAATHGGICRYDDYGFLTFNESTPDLKLKNKFVNKLCEDAFGRLWIAMDTGLDIADLLTCTPIDIGRSLGVLPKGLEDSYIRQIYRDTQDRLWLSAGSSLYCLSFSSEGKISRCHALTDIESSHVHAVVDWNGTVCAGLGNNIYALQTNNDGTISSRLLSESITPFTEDWEIQSMVAENKDILWIGTNRGLFRYNSENSTLDRYRYSNHRPGMLSQAYITDLALTASGKLIVSTRNGLNVYHPETDTFEYVRHDNDNPSKSINCNSINCLFTNGEDIWAGTETGGVNLLTPKNIITDVMPLPVNAIGEDRNGNIWAGVVEEGLNYIDVLSQSMVTYKFDQRDPYSISNNMLTGIFIDSDNHLWAYTWGVGINELDLNAFVPQDNVGAGRVPARFIRHVREDSLGLESDFLSGACEDTLSSTIWFATTRGLHYYRKSDSRFVRILLPDCDNLFESVGTLLIDDKRRLWMPTSQGLFILDLKNVGATYGRVQDPPLQVVSRQNIKTNSSFQTSDGTIWIGSDGNGLFRLISDDEGEYRFANYTVADGLPHNNIFGITEDSSHRLWIATGYGLSCLDTSLMKFTNYTQDDGLPSNQFYRNSMLWSHSLERLLVGTTNGLAVFPPLTYKENDKESPVLVSSVSISGKKHQLQSIDIHESQQNIVIDFTNLNYGRQARVRYAWRLGNGNWTETQPGVHSVQFSSLPSGKYTLQLRSTDENGHWNSKTTDFPVRVRPYFFKTPLFIIAVILIILVAIYLLLFTVFSPFLLSLFSYLKPTDIPDPQKNTSQIPFTLNPQLITQMEKLQLPSRDEELLNSAYMVIAKHYKDTEYGVDEFVRDIGFSKTWVNQRMQEIVGCSVGQFMKAYRLGIAKEVLESDTPVKSISDLAVSVGFSDPKYFSRCFKTLYGILPSDLWKKTDSTKKI